MLVSSAAVAAVLVFAAALTGGTGLTVAAVSVVEAVGSGCALVPPRMMAAICGSGRWPRNLDSKMKHSLPVCRVDWCMGHQGPAPAGRL